MKERREGERGGDGKERGIKSPLLFTFWGNTVAT